MQPGTPDPLVHMLGLSGLAAALVMLAMAVLASAAAIFAGHPMPGAAGVIVFGPCATWCTQALWRRLLAA